MLCQWQRGLKQFSDGLNISHFLHLNQTLTDPSPRYTISSPAKDQAFFHWFKVLHIFKTDQLYIILTLAKTALPTKKSTVYRFQACHLKDIYPEIHEICDL